MFLTQPETPRFAANSAIEALKKTPCTSPVIFSLTAVLARVQPPLRPEAFTGPQPPGETDRDMTVLAMTANKYSAAGLKKIPRPQVGLAETEKGLAKIIGPSRRDIENQFLL